jgi:secreted trypsin-like serine protease
MVTSSIGFRSTKNNFNRFCSTVIGWGKRKHSDESGTNVLHEAEVPIISNESCKSVYYDYVITKNMFCAGANRVDTCAGDSGGEI